MNTELENALRDKIDCLTAQLTESRSYIENLKVENEKLRNRIKSHSDRISCLNGQVEALTLCIKILSEKL